MTAPKRLSLSTLLLLMLAVAAVFGYAQWRRQWLKAEVADLNDAIRTNLEVRDGMFWPAVGQRNVTLAFTKSIHGDFVRDGKTYNYDQLMSYLSPAVVRFRAVGVDRITFSLDDESGKHIYSEDLSLDMGAE